MDCRLDVPNALGNGCRDTSTALQLKLIAIAAILVACVLGVSMPILGRYLTFFRPDSDLFFVVKAFAAGIILSSAFVHMLPTSFKALSDSCLSKDPWSKFPFSGFISMMGVLCTLCIDFWANAYYERKHVAVNNAHPSPPIDPVSTCILQESCGHREDNQPARIRNRDLSHHGSVNTVVGNEQKFASIEEACSSGDCECNVNNIRDNIGVDDSMLCSNTGDIKLNEIPDNVDCFTNTTMHIAISCDSPATDESLVSSQTQIRQRVISQVLELGIVGHSIIVGISIGATQSPCTIRPLLAALIFHQFFEGVALGGCIAQANYTRVASIIMAFFFSVTTPLGIAIGIGLSSSYNDDSPTALIVEGLFNSMSSGILVYMALVDLIAIDFLSERLAQRVHLQFYSFLALFIGTGLMSLLAYWAA